MIRHYFLTTISTLRQNPLYTILSVFGVALTFVFVSVLLLIFENSKAEFTVPGYAARTWQVQQVKQENGWNYWLRYDNVQTWGAKMTTPEITVMTGQTMETSMVNDQSISHMVLGVSDSYFDVCRLKFLNGRPINRQEIAEGLPVIVIDRNTANTFFGKKEDPIGKNIEMKGLQFRVVGVVENVSFFKTKTETVFTNMWIPINSINTATWFNCQLLFTAKDKASIADVQAEFAHVLDETNLAADTQYSIREDRRKPLKSDLGILPGVGLAAICLILMLIPALNILSLNVSKSYDRSEEIAIRKTFGAPKSTIFGQLFFENLLLTLAGAIIGMCVTPFLVQAIDNLILDVGAFSLALSLRFDWKVILMIVGPCVFTFSFLSGSIPAWLISKREIVSVLKGEVPLVMNRRRSFAWIFVEQALVFGVLLVCFTNIVNNITTFYAKGNINYDNIVVIGFDQFDTSQQEEKEEIAAQFRNMIEGMKGWSSVEMISINRSSAAPGTGYNYSDTLLRYNDRSHRAIIKYCDENFYKMFSPVLSEGEWFRDDDFSEIPPVLVTQRLADNMEIIGSAIGHNISYKGRTYRISGVVEAFKNRTINEQIAGLFLPAAAGTDLDLEYAVKYRPGQGEDFSRAFVAEFYRNFPRNEFKPEIIDLDKFNHINSLLGFTMIMFAAGIPVAFLLIFAFLGTFSLVWAHSKKRMSEFGVRLAFGCTPARLLRTLIFENLMLTTLAMLPGLIVVASLYAFDPKGWEWIVAVSAAVAIMWLFAAFSAWYPAWKASKVMPVEALRAGT